MVWLQSVWWLMYFWALMQTLFLSIYQHFFLENQTLYRVKGNDKTGYFLVNKVSKNHSCFILSLFRLNSDLACYHQVLAIECQERIDMVNTHQQNVSLLAINTYFTWSHLKVDSALNRLCQFAVECSVIPPLLQDMMEDVKQLPDKKVRQERYMYVM